MTLKIRAYQKEGIKTKKVIDKYEFCCWHSLAKWMHRFVLHKCPNCKKSFSKSKKQKR